MLQQRAIYEDSNDTMRTEKDSQVEYMNWLSKKLKIKKPEDWYEVSRSVNQLHDHIQFNIIYRI